jgi:putative flippase GtrA
MDHFLKFLVVGTLGFIINTVVLIFGVKIGLRPSLSGPIGAELAVISNFVLNNLWTFSDRKITDFSSLPFKFVQFNILSFGSVVIQFTFLKAGERLFGLEKFKSPIFNQKDKISFVPESLYTLPVVSKHFYPRISWYLLFYVSGVAVGLVVNFLVYNFIIWK